MKSQVLFITFVILMALGCQSIQKNGYERLMDDTKTVHWKSEGAHYFTGVANNLSGNDEHYILGVNQGILGFDLRITEGEYNELKRLFYMLDLVSRAKRVETNPVEDKTNPSLDEKAFLKLKEQALAIIQQVRERSRKK